MAVILNPTKREELGTSRARRLRRAGQIPAVLYGHGEANVNLAVPAGDILQAIRHGDKLVEIRGAANESALIREVQWDAFGTEVLHLDLTRVSADESVEVTVTVDLRGEAPGTKQGGVIEHVTHEITLVCPAAAIPDRLEISINALGCGASIHLSK